MQYEKKLWLNYKAKNNHLFSTKMKKCYLGFLEIRFKTLKLQYPFLLLARSFWLLNYKVVQRFVDKPMKTTWSFIITAETMGKKVKCTKLKFLPLHSEDKCHLGNLCVQTCFS